MADKTNKKMEDEMKKMSKEPEMKEEKIKQLPGVEKEFKKLGLIYSSSASG